MLLKDTKTRNESNVIDGEAIKIAVLHISSVEKVLHAAILSSNIGIVIFIKETIVKNNVIIRDNSVRFRSIFLRIKYIRDIGKTR